MKYNNVTYLQQGLFIEENDQITCIPFMKICTIQSEKPLLRIELVDNDIYIDSTLINFCSKLPSYFAQCNRSLFVNLLHISKLDCKNKRLYLAGKSYSISRRRVGYVREYYLKQITKVSDFGICLICKNKG